MQLTQWSERGGWQPVVAQLFAGRAEAPVRAPGRRMMTVRVGIVIACLLVWAALIVGLILLWAGV